MKTILKSLAIGLSLIAGSQAMDQSESIDVKGGNLPPHQEQEVKKRTPKEENAYKMWLMKQAGAEGNTNVLPEDVQIVIGQTFMTILNANPVLDGKLVYINDDGKTTFKIIDLIGKDGTIDLSNQKFFGDSSKYLLITTNPKRFFDANESSNRLVILIAPKCLIEEQIESTAETFLRIVANWNDSSAPIGFFCRLERWIDPSWFYYQTSANLFTISKNNLFNNCSPSASYHLCRHYEQVAKFHVYF